MKQRPKIIALKETTSSSELAIKNSASHKLHYEFFFNFESPHTRLSYKNDILSFYQFLSDHFPTITENKQIERVHLVAFRNYLQEKEMAPKSINRKFSALSSYFDFLIEKDHLEQNPTTAIKRPRQEVLTPTNDLSDNEVINLLNSVDEKSDSAPLHRAILFTLFTTGIRKSELINLKVKNFKKQNGQSLIEVRAKGGKILQKYLHPTCDEVLGAYRSWMLSLDRSMNQEDFFFRPTRNPHEGGEIDKPLNPKAIDYIIKMHAKRAGISTRISAHSARASYIGSALENGVALWRVSQDVGHSSVKTTEIYNKRKLKPEDGPVNHLGFLKKVG